MAGARQERIAEEIRLVIGEALVRQEIKDPRVWDAGLITITHVKVTGDLRQAIASFIVHGADEARLREVAKGLNHASGFLRRKLGDRLRLKFTPMLAFMIDRVFESEERVDALLEEIAKEKSPAPVGDGGEASDGAQAEDDARAAATSGEDSSS